MSTDLHELFKTAQGYYRRNGYDLNEEIKTDAAQREDNWHHCLALAVDDRELNSFEKLFLFSRCVRNLETELARMNNQTEGAENHE